MTEPKSGQRLVVHIGADKAGSTAIQEFLVTNRDRYKAQGIHIPAFGLSREGHRDFFWEIGSPSMLAELQRESIEPHETVLLSWENAHQRKTEDRAEFRAFVDSWLPNADVTILFYVRNQIDLVQSSLLQKVKGGAIDAASVEMCHSNESDIPLQARHTIFSPQRFLNDRLNEWKTDFPNAHFDVRVFRRDRLHNGDVVDDFNDRVGAVTTGFARPLGVANTSLTREAAACLAEFEGLVHGEVDRARAVDVLLGWQGGSTNFLTAATREAVAAYYRDDTEALLEAHPECEGVDQPLSLPADPLDVAAVDACRAFLWSAGRHPTLFADPLVGRQLAILRREGSWNKAREAGMWAHTGTSLLRFRPAMRRLPSFGGHIELTFTGRYRGPRRFSDDVRVNGVSLGEIDLLAEPVRIDLGLLGPNGEIDLELDHAPVRSTDPGADPERAFRLDSFCCELVAH